MAKKKHTFEDKMNRLDEIVENLEAGDAPLEELIKNYEEGMKLAGELRDFLNKAEMKVIELSKNNATDEKTE
jgi:exodeoxyribonuclease VII small subunit